MLPTKLRQYTLRTIPKLGSFSSSGDLFGLYWWNESWGAMASVELMTITDCTGLYSRNKLWCLEQSYSGALVLVVIMV